MRRVTITIQTENAAFGVSAPEKGAAVAGLLRELARRIERDGAVTDAPIRDTNGNRVGRIHAD